MSVQRVQRIAQRLPYSLREQVIGYARSVADVTAEIAEQAGVPMTASLRDQLALLAGLKKLYSISSAGYWAVDGAGAYLQRQDVSSVRIGSTDYSRGGDFHYALRTLLQDFDRFLAAHDLAELVAVDSYAELAQRLVNGH
jgi:hypothetical protein